jgi:hypothetical protein
MIKSNITDIDKNYLSSDVIFIALACFLNPLHSSLKNAIQLFVIDTPQNLLQALKKLVLVSHLNTFEFSFHYTKQIEVIEAKSGE